MGIMYLSTEDEESYKEKQFRKNSVSIELKMILDDASVVSPFIRMFCIDDFREMDYNDIEEIILKNTKAIAQRFSLALLNRKDCLNGRISETESV